jgi:tRNA threonylcarbamoyladenosine biosynthesis protein TsaB
MLLLAIDTSGKHGSIALARAASHDESGDSDTINVMEVVPLAGGTFSAQLVPQIAALLAKHSLTKHNLDGFVVASGPGSFTGLRVGLAAVKGLAEILGKPIAGVSLLEAAALVSGCKGKMLAALDAGRGEIYAGMYDISGLSATSSSEVLLTKDEFLTVAAGWEVVTPESSIAAAAQSAGLSVRAIEVLNAGSLIRLGWKEIQAGQTVSPDQLEANYIRRTDAEIFAKKSGF